MIVRTFMAQKLDTIAMLTCLGASPRIIFKIYLLQSLLLGLSGSVLGMIAGYGLQFSLPPKLSGLLNLNLEPVFYWIPAVHSLALGTITTLLFLPLATLLRRKDKTALPLPQKFRGRGVITGHSMGTLDSGSTFCDHHGRNRYLGGRVD